MIKTHYRVQINLIKILENETDDNHSADKNANSIVQTNFMKYNIS